MTISEIVLGRHRALAAALGFSNCQLAHDDEGYGDKAGWWLIVTADGENEVTPPFKTEGEAWNSFWKIMKKRLADSTKKVVIEITGGVLSGVYTDIETPIDVVLIDHDSAAVGEFTSVMPLSGMNPADTRSYDGGFPFSWGSSAAELNKTFGHPPAASKIEEA